MDNNDPASRMSGPNGLRERPAAPSHQASQTRPITSTVRPEGIQPGIGGLIDYLAAMYGSRFVDAYRGTSPEAMAVVWRHELQGYTADELARGLAGCKRLKFPPTLPEFAMMCRPLIDSEAALHEAVEQMRRRDTGADEWSNPAIFHAAREMGDDLAKPWPAVRTRWTWALQQAEKDIKAGRLPAEVPARPLALPEPAFVPSPPPPGARAALAAFVASFGRRPTQRTEGQDDAAAA